MPPTSVPVSVWLMLMGALALPVRALSGQFTAPSVSDSLELVEEAKDVQARYERYREQRTPPDLADVTRRCDEIVGRYCFRFPDHIAVDDWRAPEQPVELELARTRVLEDLGKIGGKIPGDLWILGQRVYYLTDLGAWTNAANLARRCGGRTHWWCTALVAYVHHRRGLWIAADEAFAQALELSEGDTSGNISGVDRLSWNIWPRFSEIAHVRWSLARGWVTGLVMGLIPVVGVPLPLISYGGTAMLTLLFGFGLLLGVYVHRDMVIGRLGAEEDL